MKSFPTGFVLRLLLVIAIMTLGINVGARLQVYENWVLVTKDTNTSFRGTVTRSMVTGDYIVTEASGQQTVIAADNVKPLKTKRDHGKTPASIAVGLVTVFVCMVLLLYGVFFPGKGKRDTA